MSPRNQSIALGVLPLLLAVLVSLCERPSVAADSKAAAPTKNSLGMTLIPISAGTFQMSSPDTEPNRSHAREGKQVEVVISNPFFISDTEVT